MYKVLQNKEKGFSKERIYPNATQAWRLLRKLVIQAIWLYTVSQEIFYNCAYLLTG